MISTFSGTEGDACLGRPIQSRRQVDRGAGSNGSAEPAIYPLLPLSQDLGLGCRDEMIRTGPGWSVSLSRGAENPLSLEDLNLPSMLLSEFVNVPAQCCRFMRKKDVVQLNKCPAGPVWADPGSVFFATHSRSASAMGSLPAATAIDREPLCANPLRSRLDQRKIKGFFKEYNP
jgi:hypothetical protein